MMRTIDLSVEVDKNLKFVQKACASLFTQDRAESVVAIHEDDEHYIQIGEYMIWPSVDNAHALINVPSVKWNLSILYTVHCYPHEPDYEDVRDVGEYRTVAECLVEMTKHEAINKVDRISEELYFAETEKTENLAETKKKYREKLGKKKNG